MSAITAGTWTIEVSGFEPSTFAVDLKPDGTVSGQRDVDGHCGTVTGTWTFADPILRLHLDSYIGLHPEPVDYEIRLTDGGHGADDEGHQFTVYAS